MFGATILNMPSPSIILFLFSAIFSIGNALPWSGPKPTTSYLPNEWTPRPTLAPSSQRELFTRNSIPVDICGWGNGDLASPVVCGTGSSCVHDTLHAYVGCCSTSGPCATGIYTSCLDVNSPDQMVANQDGVMTCGGTSICNRNTYPGGYYQFSCGASSTTRTVATTFSGQPSDLLLQVVFTGVSFTETAVSSSSTLTSRDITSTSLSSVSSSPTSSTTASSPTLDSSSSITSTSSFTTNPASSTVPTFSSSSQQSESPTQSSTAKHASTKTNFGKIIGATLGGIAGIAAISALAFYCVRRKQAKKAQGHHAGPFVSRQDPDRAPFQKIVPYTSEASPMVLNENANPPHPAVYPTSYRTLSRGQNTVGSSRNNSPPREETPLFSEIEHFPRGWNEAVLTHSRSSSQDQSDDAHYGNFTVITGGSRPTPGKFERIKDAALRLRGGELLDRAEESQDNSLGESSQDRNEEVSSEEESHESMYENVRREGWSPAPLRTTPPRPPSIPARNPRRLSERGQRPSIRYTLVDNPPRDVPILDSPGGLRNIRRGMIQ